ncbi:MAG TPA: phosphopentomutase [Gaiellaceae bacterium]|nr:phosphopentomutase [Gaiellaceae bacterium]
MPRACVIVLDAVGAGELPDAAEYGDEGSDTLGNVARAVRGLDLPALEALGLGNVEPLEGCLPQPGAPAVAGRLLERSKGKDTTTGHWELMGVVTSTPMPTYPHGFPHDVIDPFMHATGRGVIGNRAASGTEIIQELGEEHQKTGKWIVYTSADSVFQIAAHEETVPLEELYDACRSARGLLTGKHAVGRVIARPFVGEPGDYVRTTDRHDFSLEPRRPNYLSLVRDAGHRVYGVGKISDIFAGCDIDDSFPTKSNVEGINRTEELLREVDGGFVFTNLVETDMLWGHRNDPVNFHRCLQDFDRRLPDLLDALREGDLIILTSDHGCDPTTPSTDHSREHALLLAYAEGRNARGQVHTGEFADVGATVNAWLGGKPAPRAPGRRSSPLDAAGRPDARRGGVRRRDASATACRGAHPADDRSRSACARRGRGCVGPAAAGARGRLRMG